MFCDKQLAQLTKEWKAMERSTDEQRKLAEDYYKSELMPMVVECFCKNIKGKSIVNQWY